MKSPFHNRNHLAPLSHWNTELEKRVMGPDEAIDGVIAVFDGVDGKRIRMISVPINPALGSIRVEEVYTPTSSHDECIHGYRWIVGDYIYFVSREFDETGWAMHLHKLNKDDFTDVSLVGFDSTIYGYPSDLWYSTYTGKLYITFSRGTRIVEVDPDTLATTDVVTGMIELDRTAIWVDEDEGMLYLVGDKWGFATSRIVRYNMDTWALDDSFETAFAAGASGLHSIAVDDDYIYSVNGCYGCFTWIIRLDKATMTLASLNGDGGSVTYADHLGGSHNLVLHDGSVWFGLHGEFSEVADAEGAMRISCDNFNDYDHIAVPADLHSGLIGATLFDNYIWFTWTGAKPGGVVRVDPRSLDMVVFRLPMTYDDSFKGAYYYANGPITFDSFGKAYLSVMPSFYTDLDEAAKFLRISFNDFYRPYDTEHIAVISELIDPYITLVNHGDGADHRAFLQAGETRAIVGSYTGDADQYDLTIVAGTTDAKITVRSDQPVVIVNGYLRVGDEPYALASELYVHGDIQLKHTSSISFNGYYDEIFGIPRYEGDGYGGAMQFPEAGGFRLYIYDENTLGAGEPVVYTEAVRVTTKSNVNIGGLPFDDQSELFVNGDIQIPVDKTLTSNSYFDEDTSQLKYDDDGFGGGIQFHVGGGIDFYCYEENLTGGGTVVVANKAIHLSVNGHVHVVDSPYADYSELYVDGNAQLPNAGKIYANLYYDSDTAQTKYDALGFGGVISFSVAGGIDFQCVGLNVFGGGSVASPVTALHLTPQGTVHVAGSPTNIYSELFVNGDIQVGDDGVIQFNSFYDEDASSLKYEDDGFGGALQFHAAGGFSLFVYPENTSGYGAVVSPIESVIVTKDGKVRILGEPYASHSTLYINGNLQLVHDQGIHCNSYYDGSVVRHNSNNNYGGNIWWPATGGFRIAVYTSAGTAGGLVTQEHFMIVTSGGDVTFSQDVTVTGELNFGSCSQLDDEIAAIEHSLETINSGSVMLPFMMSELDDEIEVLSTSFIEVAKGRIYIPEGATSIRMAIRMKSGLYSYQAYARFKVGTGTSNNVIVTNNAYDWYTTALLDVSTLSGWQNISIEAYAWHADYHSYIQGYSFIWV